MKLELPHLVSVCSVAQSYPTLYDPLDCSLPGQFDVLLIPAKTSPILFL